MKKAAVTKPFESDQCIFPPWILEQKGREGTRGHARGKMSARWCTGGKRQLLLVKCDVKNI